MNEAIKPKGATHYAEVDGNIIYLFRSNYGFRQIKGNIIGFMETGIPLEDIKPL
jgi:hypothetical protein